MTKTNDEIMNNNIKQEILNYIFAMADPGGGFQSSMSLGWLGIADGRVSELASAAYAAEIAEMLGAEVPHKKAMIEYFHVRQSPEGYFHNLAPLPGVPTTAYLEYNTCVALRGLKALGAAPARDPRPWLAAGIRKLGAMNLPAPTYHCDFFANSFAALEDEMPADCARIVQDTLLKFQDPATGWIVQSAKFEHYERNNPMTFHAARVFHLTGARIPMADRILDQFMRFQQLDGSWSLGGVHGTFDACVTIRMLSDNSERYRKAIKLGAGWALTCRTPDGGFNHFGNSPATPAEFAKDQNNPSEMDACYFHIATLAMAGLLPMHNTPRDNWSGWGHTLLNAK